MFARLGDKICKFIAIFMLISWGNRIFGEGLKKPRWVYTGYITYSSLLNNIFVLEGNIYKTRDLNIPLCKRLKVDEQYFSMA